MREILFKAKRIDNDKWVEGYYVKKYDLLGKRHLILYVDNYVRWVCVEIDPETLCEFTGRCDKNGKRIWENDILMAHLDEFYPEDTTYETVEWGVAGWVTHEANSVDRQYLDEFDLEHFEVVGNIFDNKELLQEEYK
nr:MAG TPA: YopX protein [Caudoviricetes sp.]